MRSGVAATVSIRRSECRGTASTWRFVPRAGRASTWESSATARPITAPRPRATVTGSARTCSKASGGASTACGRRRGSGIQTPRWQQSKRPWNGPERRNLRAATKPSDRRIYMARPLATAMMLLGRTPQGTHPIVRPEHEARPAWTCLRTRRRRSHPLQRVATTKPPHEILQAIACQGISRAGPGRRPLVGTSRPAKTRDRPRLRSRAATSNCRYRPLVTRLRASMCCLPTCSPPTCRGTRRVLSPRRKASARSIS